jgi:hypothetical protein
MHLVAKVSPNGKKTGDSNNASRRTNATGPKVKLSEILVMCYYDFDSNRTVSNGIQLLNNSNPYGVEFSSKTKKLYVTENHFDSGGDKIVESVLIQFKIKHSIIKTVIETSPLYISGLYNWPLTKDIPGRISCL